MTETTITLFWRPAKLSAVFHSADGYAERRTFVSRQNFYETGALLPDTRYNVSIWLLQPQNSPSSTSKNLSLITNGSISTSPLGRSKSYRWKQSNVNEVYIGHDVTSFIVADSFQVDISVERTKLVFRWQTPTGIQFNETSPVLVTLSNGGRSTTITAGTWTGYIRTELIGKGVGNFLRVSLEFEGYMSKRIALLFLGRVMRLEQSEVVFRPFSDHT